MRQRLEAAHAAGSDHLSHLGHGGRCRAELRTPVHQRQTPRPRSELERPIERRIAAAKDDQVLALERPGILHPVENAPPLERFGTLYAELSGLKRADSSGDHHRAGIEPRARGGADRESPILPAGEVHDLLPEMEVRLEGLDLLHQPLDQLLRAADRQRRNVIDGLVRVELGALAARMRQRIDHVSADAEQAQLEDLEKAARTRTDDDHFSLDRLAGGWQGIKAQYQSLSVMLVLWEATRDLRLRR